MSTQNNNPNEKINNLTENIDNPTDKVVEVITTTNDFSS